jgi:hypothetical protein
MATKIGFNAAQLGEQYALHVRILRGYFSKFRKARKEWLWYALFIFGAQGCLNVRTESIEVKPIHITVDENVKVEKALEDFFGPIDRKGPHDQIPEFPERPPQPSDYTTVPSRFVALDRNDSTYGTVAHLIGAALEASGYSQSYYQFRDGFAVVARLEQCDGGGHPLPSPDRWSVNIPPMRSFDLGEYLQRLFSAPAGYYRLIVLVVCSSPIEFDSRSLSEEKADRFFREGATSLPGSMTKASIVPGSACVALIYEFQKTNNTSAVAVNLRPRFSAQEHMMLSGIYAHFNSN